MHARRNAVTWPTEFINQIRGEAHDRQLALVKVHSHRRGREYFSALDNASDDSVYAAVFSLLNDGLPHASVIMQPDGRMVGRAIIEEAASEPLSSIMVVGDDINVWPAGRDGAAEEFSRRHEQIFGAGTNSPLRGLSVGVVGCSGTGSIIVEQLARG